MIWLIFSSQWRRLRGFFPIIAGLGLLLSPGNGVFPLSAKADPPVSILVFGDSLTAGYGLQKEEAFPSVLETRLLNLGFPVKVINGGVSGDTTAAGLARLDWSLASEPDIVILALGGNDALRGLPPAQTLANLDMMIEKIKTQNTRILLAGMLAPRNLDDTYIAEFDSIFGKLATRHNTAFYPFFLEGVAFDPALNLADGFHPNAQGVTRMVEGILPVLRPLLEEETPPQTAPSAGQ